ncbi:hypothetical protein GCM10023147_05670 [Tsukamurella soli]|uniref:Uncharacterized protein n=1 Tax=Tsukamurella soli TaxID=644556 RepID=A0ABP8J495_9ACTN
MLRHAEGVDELVGVCALRHRRRPAGRELGGVGEAGEYHVAHGEWHVDPVPRVDMPDVRAEFAHVDAAEAFAEHVDGAARGVGDGAAQPEQGRLASKSLRPPIVSAIAV